MRDVYKRQIQVLIVEDDPMARTLFEIYLKNSEKYKVAGSVESAAMAELYCLTKQIDLILMDVCTALHASGLDAAEDVYKRQRLDITETLARTSVSSPDNKLTDLQDVYKRQDLLS